ncbi:MAG TPA: hypothetical protein VMM84_06850 [Pyrinomonadaceae bacterium]|nr:hypothetical protein [Pyrinomonadaceae bacterium]
MIAVKLPRKGSLAHPAREVSGERQPFGVRRPGAAWSIFVQYPDKKRRASARHELNLLERI